MNRKDYFEITYKFCEEALEGIEDRYFKKQCYCFLRALRSIFYGEVKLSEHETFYGMGIVNNSEVRFWFVDVDVEIREYFPKTLLTSEGEKILSKILNDYGLPATKKGLYELTAEVIIKRESAVDFLDLFLTLLDSK